MNSLEDANVRWADCLERLPTHCTPEQVTLIRAFWQRVVERFGSKALPGMASEVGEDLFWIAWNTKPKYLEVEFYRDGAVEWFYRDRVANISDGTKDEPHGSVPNVVLDRLAEIMPSCLQALK